MDKCRMTSRDLVQDNIDAIGQLFPNCIKEVQGEDGKPERGIDFEVLKQELSRSVIEGRPERYEFNWPGKRAASLTANTPIKATLRPCREESVNFDTTENLYIEGDNLDVLKLLCDNYRGKIKMIYIDPPYNTGNDFIYEDDFAQTGEEYRSISGDYDDQGNRLAKNTTASGRFHTDWLNMMYPRLRIAQKLLSDDGVIFISIDDNEVTNLRKICDEIFGPSNFVADIKWKGRGGRQDSKYFAVIHEDIICYAKSLSLYKAGEEVKDEGVFPKFDEQRKRYYKTQLLRKWGSNSLRENRPNLYYPITAPDGTDVYPTIYEEISQVAGVSTPATCNFREIAGRWRWGTNTMEENIKKGNIEFQKNKFGKWVAYERIYAPTEDEIPTKKYTTWIDYIQNGTQSIKDIFGKAIFDYSKSPELILHFLKMSGLEKDSIILDFFSGSATTAHAVMQLNAEDGGHRKFIMVQLPEACAEGSEAAKAGFKNICSIGKERIRRAGAKIASENATTAPNLDIGFRVLKLDSSNMTDVYYSPDELKQEDLFGQADNVKEGRTAEDLLFQVMLEKDIPLSSKIETETVAGMTIYNVAGGYLLACFDKGVTDEVVTAIAKKHPVHAVFRDAGMATDSTAINFEQIFASYSPDTKRAIL